MSTTLTERPVILVVDDDNFLRMDAVEILIAAGYLTVEAGNPDQALAILEARPDIEVVFTDVQMPGSMDGLRLAQCVKDRWPPIRIVATSGLTDLRTDDLPEGGRFLAKPYAPAQVVRAIGEVLNERR